METSRARDQRMETCLIPNDENEKKLSRFQDQK